MKYITYSLAFVSLLLSACGGGGGAALQIPEKAADIRALISQKRDNIATLEGEIKQLETALGKADTSAKIEKRILVTTQPVALKTFQHFVNVQGNVATAENPAAASSETGGRIVEMLAREGQFIKKGDLVARVNLESIQKSVEELTKSMELAEDIFKRQEKLWEQKIGSEVQYLQAKNQVESLQKTKERLEHELKKANVYAPASGVVEKVILTAGEVCGPGTPIIQIVNSANLKVIANVSENYLTAVKRGDMVRIAFPAINIEQEARVNNIGRIINAGNRTFEVEMLIDSKGGMVKPNLLATVYIKDYEKANVATVTSELIMQDVNGNNYVMLRENNRAVKRIVQIGKTFNNETEIVEGLKGGEELLVKGARQVVEGDLVEIIEGGKG